MKSFKILLIFGLFIFTADFCSAGATEGQVNEIAKLMRNICQPEFEISNDLADGIRVGKFPDDKNLKCYVNCVLELQQIMKKGTFVYETALRLIDLLLPENLKPDYRKGFKACKNSATAFKNQHCEASYALLKCLHANTEHFMFA